MNRLASLEDIYTFSKENRCINIPISGDCMEAADICDGDIVSVDFTKMPESKIKDIVLCYDETYTHSLYEDIDK